MNLLTIIGIALGLAMDAFAVSIAVGSNLPRVTFRHFFRLSFHFGLFQFMMPIIGWYGGTKIARFIEHFDHWVAFGLLLFIGGKMIYESFGEKESISNISDPTRRWSLIMLSIATSIDAFAVGLSIAMLNYEIWFASVIIGIVAALLTSLGMLFGRQLGGRFGKRMELVGGLILIGIGLKIVFGHIA
jgi:putative Mn2+ efflux pump MntP